MTKTNISSADFVCNLFRPFVLFRLFRPFFSLARFHFGHTDERQGSNSVTKICLHCDEHKQKDTKKKNVCVFNENMLDIRAKMKLSEGRKK